MRQLTSESMNITVSLEVSFTVSYGGKTVSLEAEEEEGEADAAEEEGDEEEDLPDERERLSILRNNLLSASAFELLTADRCSWWISACQSQNISGCHGTKSPYAINLSDKLSRIREKGKKRKRKRKKRKPVAKRHQMVSGRRKLNL